MLGTHVLWREIIGNAFGLVSAIGGMRRRTWAWPVGIVGNVLLFTVFLGGVFSTPQNHDLYGQAGRQVFFLLASVYGWVVWRRTSRAASTTPGGSRSAVTPHWGTTRERLAFLLIAVVGLVVADLVLQRLNSFNPLADGWIFVGSLLATLGMARGMREFWLIWIAVDAVGVPLLLQAKLYPSAIMYIVYGGFCIWGFAVWLRSERPGAPTPVDPSLEAVG